MEIDRRTFLEKPGKCVLLTAAAARDAKLFSALTCNRLIPIRSC